MPRVRPPDSESSDRFFHRLRGFAAYSAVARKQAACEDTDTGRSLRGFGSPRPRDCVACCAILHLPEDIEAIDKREIAKCQQAAAGNSRPTRALTIYGSSNIIPAGAAQFRAAVPELDRWAASHTMTIRINVSLVATVLAFVVSGCAHSRQMSRDEIVRTAEQTAVARGVRLAAFEAPVVKPASRQGTWIVHYRGKVPPGQEDFYGNYFLVAADERTGETHFVPGE